MQVDPIKFPLKAPGTKRTKLEHEILLCDFAFNFNLRHYNDRIRNNRTASRDGGVGVVGLIYSDIMVG